MLIFGWIGYRQTSISSFFVWGGGVSYMLFSFLFFFFLLIFTFFNLLIFMNLLILCKIFTKMTTLYKNSEEATNHTREISPLNKYTYASNIYSNPPLQNYIKIYKVNFSYTNKYYIDDILPLQISCSSSSLTFLHNHITNNIHIVHFFYKNIDDITPPPPPTFFLTMVL